MNKIFFLTFVAISLFFSIEVGAQENQRENNRRERSFDREAFEAKRNAFITAEMNLTPEEAAAFIPLCDELRRKKFDVGNDCRRLSREISKKDNPTNEEYLKTIDECLGVNAKEAQLDKDYYEKFKKILSPEKLYKYRDAEFKFARHFMRNEGDHDWGNRGGRDQKQEKK